MKENTKQILKVSICTLMALVLFAGVILMCIYFAFDNSNDGVADAFYTDEEIGVSNVEFTVDDGFYIKNMNNEDDDYYERLINYYLYFCPDLMNPDVSFSYNVQAGSLRVDYTSMLGNSLYTIVPIYIELYKFSESDILRINALISQNYDLYLFYFDYNFAEGYLDDFVTDLVFTDTKNNFYVDFDDHPQLEGTFAYQLTNEVFGSVDDVYSIDSLSFTFKYSTNLGIFFSPNETFASPPVVMPEGVYDDTLQDKYNEGYDDGLAHYLPLIQSLQQEKTQLQQQITTLQQEKTQLQQQITTLQQDNSELQSQINILQQEKSQLQQQITELQNQINQKNVLIEELQHNNNVLQDTNDYLQRQIDNLQSTIDELELTNSELQAQLDYYKTFYDASNWFNFIDSSYNNVKTAYFDGMKTTLKYTFDTGDSIGVALADDTGTAQGLIAYLDFGTMRAKDDLVRFSWKDLRIWPQSGSSGPGAFMPVHIAVLSDGSLIDCFVTTEDMMIDGSCEFTLPVSADGLYLYNSDASTFIFVSGMIGQYYSYDSELIYNNGFDAGYNDGRDDGIQYGEQVGYENGYADAREKYINNDYSFFALFSSVLDAPLQMIIGTDDKPGMLNFYIPGLDINIAPFLLSLFSVALVITIIRFILARAS